MSSPPEEISPSDSNEIELSPKEASQNNKKKSRKRENHVDGEVVFVQEEKIQVQVPQVVSTTKMDKELRPKKPLSQAQQDNLKRLIELNKTRREDKLSLAAKEKLNDPKTYEVPTEVPEGMVPVIVKAKQKYNKTGNFSKFKKESERQSPKESDLEEKFNQLQKKFEELELNSKEVKPKSFRPKKTKPDRASSKSLRRERDSESESESVTETEPESDVDYSKIKKKIDKRVQVIQDLDRKISSANKYANLSIF
jgi:hypothetical protein